MNALRLVVVDTDILITQYWRITIQTEYEGTFDI